MWLVPSPYRTTRKHSQKRSGYGDFGQHEPMGALERRVVGVGSWECFGDRRSLWCRRLSGGAGMNGGFRRRIRTSEHTAKLLLSSIGRHLEPRLSALEHPWWGLSALIDVPCSAAGVGFGPPWRLCDLRVRGFVPVVRHQQIGELHHVQRAASHCLFGGTGVELLRQRFGYADVVQVMTSRCISSDPSAWSIDCACPGHRVSAWRSTRRVVLRLSV